MEVSCWSLSIYLIWIDALKSWRQHNQYPGLAVIDRASVLNQFLTASERQWGFSLPREEPRVSEATPAHNQLIRQSQSPASIPTSSAALTLKEVEPPVCVLDFISSFPVSENSIYLVYPECCVYPEKICDKRPLLLKAFPSQILSIVGILPLTVYVCLHTSAQRLTSQGEDDIFFIIFFRALVRSS